MVILDLRRLHERAQLPRRTIAFVRKVTDNILEQFAQGPVGHPFPAEDNVSQFNLPTANQVSAS